MNVITKTVSLPDGRTISIETGKLAKQADGAVMLRMNNTMLLATVCGAKDAVPGTDFMPLQCDYKEKYSAVGRFPGGFTKREGRAGDYEILTSRLVDRALRPLFPSDYHAEVYVNVTVPFRRCVWRASTVISSSTPLSNNSKAPTWTSWWALPKKTS